MTDDEKIQRLKAEQRHNQLVELLTGITLLLKNILEELKEEDTDEEKKEW